MMMMIMIMMLLGRAIHGSARAIMRVGLMATGKVERGVMLVFVLCRKSPLTFSRIFP